MNVRLINDCRLLISGNKLLKIGTSSQVSHGVVLLIKGYILGGPRGHPLIQGKKRFTNNMHMNLFLLACDSFSR